MHALNLTALWLNAITDNKVKVTFKKNCNFKHYKIKISLFGDFFFALLLNLSFRNAQFRKKKNCSFNTHFNETNVIEIQISKLTRNNIYKLILCVNSSGVFFFRTFGVICILKISPVFWKKSESCTSAFLIHDPIKVLEIFLKLINFL